MSEQTHQWWKFLDACYEARELDPNFKDWRKIAKNLDLDFQTIREFMGFFEADFEIGTKLVLEICLGASCIANGALDIVKRIEAVNHGKLPEDQLKVRHSFCLNECDRGPCARDSHHFYAGKDLKWLARYETEGQ